MLSPQPSDCSTQTDAPVQTQDACKNPQVNLRAEACSKSCLYIYIFDEFDVSFRPTGRYVEQTNEQGCFNQCAYTAALFVSLVQSSMWKTNQTSQVPETSPQNIARVPSNLTIAIDLDLIPPLPALKMHCPERWQPQHLPKLKYWIKQAKAKIYFNKQTETSARRKSILDNSGTNGESTLQFWKNSNLRPAKTSTHKYGCPDSKQGNKDLGLGP